MKAHHKLIYDGVVTEAGVLISPRERIKNEVGAEFRGRSVKITIEAEQQPRSRNQDGYWYTVMLPMLVKGFIEVGNPLRLGCKEDHEYVHRIMVNRFLQNGIEIVDANGEVHTTDSSLARAKMSETAGFMDRVIDFALEALNVRIPPPNKDWRKHGGLGEFFLCLSCEKITTTAHQSTTPGVCADCA